MKVETCLSRRLFGLSGAAGLTLAFTRRRPRHLLGGCWRPLPGGVVQVEKRSNSDCREDPLKIEAAAAAARTSPLFLLTTCMSIAVSDHDFPRLALSPSCSGQFWERKRRVLHESSLS